MGAAGLGRQVLIGPSNAFLDPFPPPRLRLREPRVPAEVLLSPGEHGFLAVVPAPPECTVTDAVSAWLPTGWRAIVGPTTNLDNLRASRQASFTCLDLMRRGVIHAEPAEAVIPTADHLAAILLCQNAELLNALVDERLRMLDPLTDKQHDRAVTTLLAWLHCGGNAPRMAAALKVHPQTIRYRLHWVFGILPRRTLESLPSRLNLQAALWAPHLSRRSAGTHPMEQALDRPA